MNHLFRLVSVVIFIIVLFLPGLTPVTSVSDGSDSVQVKEVSRNGYAITIPAQWTVQEEGDSVTISLPDGTGSIFIDTGPAGPDLGASHQAFLESCVQSAIAQFHLAGYAINSENKGRIADMPAVSTVFTMQDKSGSAIVSAIFTMATSTGVLHLMFTESQDRYESAYPGFEDLLRSLTLSGPLGTPSSTSPGTLQTSAPATERTPATSAVITVASPRPTISQSGSAVPGTAQGSEVYSTDSYSFSHPADWTVTEGDQKKIITIPRTGILLSVMQQAHEPDLSLFVDKVSSGLEKNLENYQVFKKEQTVIAGQNWLILHASCTSDGQPVIIRIYFLNSPKSLIRFQLIGHPEEIQAVEEGIASMISSLALKQSPLKPSPAPAAKSPVGKTYSTGSYSFSYPAEWTVTEEDGMITVSIPETLIKLHVVEKPLQQNLEKYVQEISAEDKMSFEDYQVTRTEPLEIAGRSGILLEASYTSGGEKTAILRRYYLNGLEKLYIIQLLGYPEEIKTVDKEINQMVSSFTLK